MRVLLCIRGDYIKSFAGDSKIVLKTAEYLKKNGIEVKINMGDTVDYSKYDIIHLFNITRMGETYKYYKQAHKNKKIIVATPMYFDMTRYYNYKNETDNAKLWEKSQLYRKEILQGCRKIYPSSSWESDIISRDFSAIYDSTVIYNGVEVEHDETPLYNLKERYNLNNYVLCVGRINPQKNQLSLVRACYKLGIKVVLIGEIVDKAYFNECKRYNNVVYLGFVDSYNIYNAYRFAKLHVLPGFVEMSGMSSLEAAASGCNIVTTQEGSSREYFKDMAIYCDPYCEDSLISSIERAIRQKKNNRLKNHILQNYSWDKSVNQLIKSYKDLL